MTRTAHLKEPSACTAKERREFERLVRQGFDGSDAGLPGRILDARQLAFCHEAGGTLVAMAALKMPDGRYREDVFTKAGAEVSPADYRLELGWVFVTPLHRGNQISEDLCGQLLACVPGSRVLATTRPDNTPMINVLLALGFGRIGKPYPRRNEELALFLRPPPAGRG
jgi:hypothetical protein